MYALDHAAAREKRPEDREQERHDDEHDVPFAQHPALFLDHDRMQERSAGEPRQKRRVLDGIPRPVASPSELDVRPPHAEHDTDGQKEPGQERPAPNDGEPFRIQSPRNQRGDGKCKWNGGGDVAQIEVRRMNRHAGVLELRIHPAAVHRRPVEAREGIRLEARRGEEEQKNRA